MPVVSVDPAVVEVESALTTIVRRSSLPRLQEQILRDAGLEMDRAAYPMLRRLAELAPVRVTELARAMNIDASTASRQIRQLEKLDFVARTSDSSDARVSMVTLTDRGAEAMESVGVVRRSMLDRIVAPWSDEEREVFATLLSRLAAGIVEYGDGGQV